MTVKQRYLSIGLALGILLSGTAALAQNKMIEVDSTPLQYFFNGQQKTPAQGEEGFIYNDHTYVPIRFISEALGFDVKWNGEQKRIGIDTAKAAVDTKTYALEKNTVYRFSADGTKDKGTKVSDLKNMKRLLSETKYFTRDNGTVRISAVGIYKSNLILSIECYDKDFSKDTGTYQAVYRYNLSNDLFNLVDNASTAPGGYGTQIRNDRLFIDNEDMMNIYDLNSMEKTFRFELGSQIQLQFDGDYMYYFSTQDYDSKRYILYKQRLGQQKGVAITEFPFLGALKVIDGEIYCLSDDNKTVYRVDLDGAGLEQCELANIFDRY